MSDVMNAPASRAKKKSGGQAAINAHAVRAVVQILFATGKPYTLETLRERVREFFVEENDSEKRAVASMSAVQLITAILEAGPQLEALGCRFGSPMGWRRFSRARSRVRS